MRLSGRPDRSLYLQLLRIINRPDRDIRLPRREIESAHSASCLGVARAWK